MSTISVGGPYALRSVVPRPAARVAPSGSRPARLRITRRGRAVLTVLVAVPLAVAATVGGIGAFGADASNTTPSGHYTYVTVQSGESLWQLAEQVAPNSDPRDVVADITSLNALESGVIQPGQRLAIPEQYAR
jgi:LysM domain